MSLTQFITFLTQATIFLIGLLTLIDYLRQQNQLRLDIALMFTDLAVIVLFQWLSELFPGWFPWTGVLGSLLLVAHPYLLLRLVNHRRPVSPFVLLIGLAGLILSWLFILIFPGVLPIAATIFIVIYMVTLEAFSAVILIQGARSTRGVSHWRLLLGSFGSFFLIGYLVTSGINAAVPSAAHLTGPLIQILALTSMLAYFFGFAPPNWLRRIWQFSEFFNYLKAAFSQGMGESLEQKLLRLSVTAESVTGGDVAAVALWDKDKDELVISVTSNQDTARIPSMEHPAIQAIWRAKAPAMIPNPAWQETKNLEKSPSGWTGSLLIVPIATQEITWGILLVAVDRVPLFASEDLELLALFNAQAATSLGYERLLLEQKSLIEQLQMFNQRLQSFNDIVRAILEARSTRDITTRALLRLRAQVPSQRASVALFNLEARQGQMIAVSADGDMKPAEGSLLPMDDFPHFDAFKPDRKVSYLEDLSALHRLPPLLETLRDQGIRSMIYTPLVAEDRLIGAIALSSPQVAAYQSHHLDVLREVADRLALGIQQSNLRERLQQTNLELENRVEERTLELQKTVESLHEVIEARQQATEALRIAQDRLKLRASELNNANKELEAFAYSVSHDLRAPLRAIDGFSRILLDKHASELNEEGRRYLGIVCANTQQMGELIDDLLAFSRLNRQSMNVQQVDPASLARLAMRDLVKEQEDREVEIIFGELPPCQADPILLKQVFVNLLSNALKFTSKQKDAKIEINCLDKDGETVYYVKDNGVGFDMRYADKLFGVFQRLHRSDEFEGTGVGLAIVQRVINRHGGRVWAEAEVNRGATFYFTIPDSQQG